MTRIQRTRRRGDRLPPGSVVCTRPGPLGNPFKPSDILTPVKCIRLFKVWAEAAFEFPESNSPDQKAFVEAIERIEREQPKHLACFCALSSQCHVDVILELLKKRRDSNGKDSQESPAGSSVGDPQAQKPLEVSAG